LVALPLVSEPAAILAGRLCAKRQSNQEPRAAFGLVFFLIFIFVFGLVSGRCARSDLGAGFASDWADWEFLETPREVSMGQRLKNDLDRIDQILDASWERHQQRVLRHGRFSKSA
jgi:hypothetical protein